MTPTAIRDVGRFQPEFGEDRVERVGSIEKRDPHAISGLVEPSLGLAIDDDARRQPHVGVPEALPHPHGAPLDRPLDGLSKRLRRPVIEAVEPIGKPDHQVLRGPGESRLYDPVGGVSELLGQREDRLPR